MNCSDAIRFYSTTYVQTDFYSAAMNTKYFLHDRLEASEPRNGFVYHDHVKNSKEEKTTPTNWCNHSYIVFPHRVVQTVIMKLLFTRRVLTSAAVVAAFSAQSLVAAQNSTSNSTAAPDDGVDFIDDPEDTESGGTGNIGDILGIPACEDAATAYAFCFIKNQEACIEACNTTATGLGDQTASVAGATCDEVQQPACDLASCCPQCDQEFIDVAECYISNTGNKTLCTITCESGSGGGSGGGGDSGAGSDSPARNTRWLLVTTVGSALAMLVYY